MEKITGSPVFRFSISRLVRFLAVCLLVGATTLLIFNAPEQALAEPAAAAAADISFTGLLLDPMKNDYNLCQAWGDMDGDGDLDLAVGTQSQVNRVYRNDGNGSFTELPGALGYAQERTEALAWGDMDNDGDLDLGVGNWSGGTYNRLYRNDGGGVFTELAGALAGSNSTTSLAWGDVDGDGDLDLAAGNYNGRNILYRNNGNGSFSSESGAFGPVRHYTRSIAWGDMDGDGDLDLAQGNDNNQINYLYRNDGTGNFTELSDRLGGLSENTTSVAWGDMDGDGDLDLAVGNRDQPNRLHRNEGNGYFTTLTLDNNVYTTESLAWGDADSDGDLDLAAGNWGQAARLYLNSGAGVFSEAPGALGSVASSATSIGWGDMDGDGDLDLAITYAYYAYNRLYRNNQGNMFSELPGALGPFLGNTTSLAWGDMDHDNDLDLAIGYGYHNSGEVNHVFRNRGKGVFEEAPGALGSAADITTSVAWGDADGDGDLDLAIGNEGQVNRLYRNDGGGVFTEIPNALGSAIDHTNSLAWGDMDGDGDLDLAVGNGYIMYNGGEVNRLYRNEGGWVFTELPGALGSAADITTSLAWGDIDGDGDLDLVAGNGGCNVGQVNRLYRNDGAGIFTMLTWGNPSDITMSLALGDMDGDGDLDLVAGNGGWYGLGQVNRLYRNDSQGNFTELPLALGIYAESTYGVAWGDMDGDGDLDLAVGNGGDFMEVNRLYRNDSGGVFTEVAGALGNLARRYRGIAWGDMDGDGDLDLAIGDIAGDDRIFVNPLQHPTDSLPSNPLSLAVGQPSGLAAANFYAISGSLTSPLIPFTYTLISPDGSPAAQVLAQYSLDGGGQWYTATGSALTSSAGIFANFDPSIGTQWQLSANTVITTGLCGGASGYGLNFTGTLPRTVTTRPLNLTTGGKISFSLRIGAGAAPCEATNPGEDILLEYSLDGNTWSQLAAYSSGMYPTFTAIEITIPPEARSPATRLRWRQPVFSEPTGDNWALDDVRIEIPNVFWWDTLASGFFGQSSNIIMRFKAIPVRTTASAPGSFYYFNNAAGPFQQAFASTMTMPFPARGTQVRVFDEQISASNTIANALVYRLPQGSQTGAKPIAAPDGQPYRTDANGYLAGRGQLGLGDTLYAMLPISTTTRYTLYATNGIPLTDTQGSYQGHLVEQAGVQNLVVSTSRLLLAFNLDISLEWDARNDGNFLQDLDDAIQKASAVLFDISDGQITLGDVKVYQNRQNWLSSDIVIYAQTGIRPRASMGGVVEQLTDDLYHDGSVIQNAYGPGQIRIGPNWDPFGTSIQELTVDWQRALAHELAHYLLYLPDNYLGIGPDGAPISTDCRGSFMTNTYDDDYSEFLTNSGWVNDCTQTIAEHTTGRVDWETVQKFYSALIQPAALNPGPATLPLDITQVTFVSPGAASQVMPPRFFDVRLLTSGLLKAVPKAQVFLFQDRGTPDLTDDQVLPMGSTLGDGDRARLRGALPGDRLCLFGPPDPVNGQSYSGCIESLALLNTAIPVSPISDWQPNIIARAVTSTTLQVTVTLRAPAAALNVQFFPAYGDAFTTTVYSPVAAMTLVTASLPTTPLYTATLSLPFPAFEGWLRAWVPGADPVHETMSQLFLSPPWGPNNQGYIGGGNTRAWGANNRQLGAPVASGDGQVSIFNFTDIFSDTGTLSLQALNSLPGLPSWLSQVGQGYRFLSNTDFDRAIAFDYLQREVPPGYEFTLTIYYSPDEGYTWQRLPTRLEEQYNRATAVMPANALHSSGIYALIATIELPALDQGWNLFSFPLPVTRTLPLALDSIWGKYTSVYFSQGNTWKLFDATVLRHHPDFAPLVNDLAQFDPYRSYWLYATEPVTPYLGVPAASSAAIAADISLPPATFFGWVQPWLDFQPQLGDPVTAWINGNQCGSCSIRLLHGHLAYKLQVASDALEDGCGKPGRNVFFQIGEHTLFWNLRLWDNTQAWFHPLGPPNSFTFIPFVSLSPP